MRKTTFPDTVPRPWFGRPGKFVFGFGSVRSPTGTSLLQVKLLAGARRRAMSGGPVPQQHCWYDHRCRRGSCPRHSQQQWQRQRLGPPSLGPCLPAPVLAERGVTAQVTGAELAAWPRASHRSPKRRATGPAQLQPSNFSPDANQWIDSLKAQASKAARGCSKQVFPCLLAALSNACLVPHSCGSDLHTSTAKSPPACKIYL